MAWHGKLLMDVNPGDPHTMRQALAFQQRAAELGDVDGMFMAGLTLGLLGNASGARHWLQRAESAGHPRARSVMDNYL